MNHAGLSDSSWYKKAAVPFLFDGGVINFVEILQDIFPKVSKIKISSGNSVVVYATVIFDQKAVSPGGCVYSGGLYGILPPISGVDAVNLLQNGYRNMLQTLIAEFKEENRKWVEQGEVFLLQLMDHLIAIPVGIYLLDKSGTHEDIEQRVKEVLLYVTACGTCLHQCKVTGNPSRCITFCAECFSNKEVCQEHRELYDDIWQCDARPCEFCARKIKNGSEVTCIRFRVMLSISDQDSAYEKFGHMISTSLEDFLAGNRTLSYPFCHIHDIGHNLKNSQASLDRGTHFDGEHIYDSTDLALLTTVPDDVVQIMCKGISHKAIAQLDKHSDEQSAESFQ